MLLFSYTSLLLAQHITPAFIRIAGPSTKLLRYSDEADDELSDILYEGDGRLVVTPSVFTALNDWLSESNLTPVFAINDVDKVNGTWDPKPWMPLFELSDRLNLSCYWQLGHGKQLKNTLITLIVTSKSVSTLIVWV